MHPHAQIITAFYTAFQARDALAMAHCYHPEVCFHDEVFPELHGPAAAAMWQMLIARGRELSLVFDDVWADGASGRAHWVATYPFSKTGRIVVNDVRAEFTFRDGLIVAHTDRFDFWRWSRMALGPAGLLLGWSTALRSKVQAQGAQALAEWIAAHPGTAERP
jgi:ketosteroid isomerase-like protein